MLFIRRSPVTGKILVISHPWICFCLCHITGTQRWASSKFPKDVYSQTRNQISGDLVVYTAAKKLTIGLHHTTQMWSKRNFINNWSQAELLIQCEGFAVSGCTNPARQNQPAKLWAHGRAATHFSVTLEILLYSICLGEIDCQKHVLSVHSFPCISLGHSFWDLLWTWTGEGGLQNSQWRR